MIPKLHFFDIARKQIFKKLERHLFYDDNGHQLMGLTERIPIVAYHKNAR